MFGLPFLAFGVGAIVGGISNLLKGELAGAFLIVFGVIFGGVGLLVPIAAWRGAKRQQELLARREAHREEPWMDVYRRDVGAGVLGEHDRRATGAATQVERTIDTH